MHFSPDVINGVYETIGALANGRSVLVLRKSKRIEGVCWTPWVWFCSWGVWNLYYYPTLNQPFSFLGGVLMVLANSAWVGHVAYYKRYEAWELLKKNLSAVQGVSESVRQRLKPSKKPSSDSELLRISVVAHTTLTRSHTEHSWN